MFLFYLYKPFIIIFIQQKQQLKEKMIFLKITSKAKTNTLNTFQKVKITLQVSLQE